MKLFIEPAANPCHNLAVEETLFDNLTDDCLYLWRNEPSVIIGRNQEVFAEVDTDYAQRHNIHIVRRLTGGGAVYHDLGNINVSYIFNCDERGQRFDDKVGRFLDLFIAYLQSIGLQPILTGRNDICVHDAQGNLRKISGTAMTQKGTRGMFHLCLLFDTNINHMERVLTPSAEKLASKGVASVRSRTVNIKELNSHFADWSNNRFFDAVTHYFAGYAALAEIPAQFLSHIDDLKKTRYEHSEWIFNRKYRKEK